MLIDGTAGALKRDVKVRDVVLAQGATTDSKMNEIQFGGLDYAPIADFDLLLKAYNAGKEAGLNLRVGNVYTADLFYGEKNPNDLLADYGVLAVEMETAALYTLAAKYNAQALAVLTISDHLITGEVTTSEERQTTFKEMMVVALEAAIAE